MPLLKAQTVFSVASQSRVCKAVRTTKHYAIPESYLSAKSMCLCAINHTTMGSGTSVVRPRRQRQAVESPRAHVHRFRPIDR